MKEQVPPEILAQVGERQRKENFEALGRYIQSFEYMVTEARLGIMQTTTDRLDTIEFLDVILSHHVFSAQPLFEVFRATADMYVARWKAVNTQDRDFVRVILKDIHKRATAAIAMRNNIVHGMHIDSTATPETEADFSRLIISKRKVGQSGLTPADVPRDRQELQRLASDCYDIRDLTGGMKGWMFRRLTSVPYQRPTEFFIQREGTWVSLLQYDRVGDRSGGVDLRSL